MRQLGIVTYEFKSGCLSSTKRKGEKTAAVAKTSACGSMPSLPSHTRAQSSVQNRSPVPGESRFAGATSPLWFLINAGWCRMS
jgi:hypothetical protein